MKSPVSAPTPPQEPAEVGPVVDVPEVSGSRPAPPKGYASWLDYAVDTLDTRSAELELLLAEEPGPEIPTREAMRQAAISELKELQQKAGIRGQHRLSELMAEMPEGLPRAEGWDDANSR